MTMHSTNFNISNNLTRRIAKIDQEEIYVKIGNVLKKIYLKDICWFGVDGKHAFAKLETRSYPLSLSLKDLEERLNNTKFIRIHQSFMVDLKKIDAINLIENIVTIKGEHLPIGRSFKKNLLSQINCF